MLQSCEILITKINEWQKAILELDKLSDEFLASGDNKLKPEIDAIIQETKKLAEEYQKSAYPKLFNGKKLFWVEKKLLEEFFGKKLEFYYPLLDLEIKKGNIKSIVLSDLGSLMATSKQLDLSLFQNLQDLYVHSCGLKILPNLPELIRNVYASSNPGLKLPDELIMYKKYKNLKLLDVRNCGIGQLPNLF